MACARAVSDFTTALAIIQRRPSGRLPLMIFTIPPRAHHRHLLQLALVVPLFNLFLERDSRAERHPRIQEISQLFAVFAAPEFVVTLGAEDEESRVPVLAEGVAHGLAKSVFTAAEVGHLCEVGVHLDDVERFRRCGRVRVASRTYGIIYARSVPPVAASCPTVA